MRQILHLLPKPSHYAGREFGSVQKDRNNVKLHIAMAFPDAYEVGMSYLGQKILYGIVNDRPEWYAERVMAPEAEACAILRERQVPLATLESDTPLGDLHAICFSVTHELCCTDILNMMDLAGIPVWQRDRPESLHTCPVIIGGGGAMLGAEPLSPFFDLIALGDGEEMLPEILELLQKARQTGLTRSEFLLEARHIPGVYVPSLFTMQTDGALVSEYADYRPRRRIVIDLDTAPYPERQVSPVGAVHSRLSLEVARGCTRGCRFCHAGMVYRPVRERQPENTAELTRRCLKNTGYDEVSFLALSAGDCTALKTMHKAALDLCRREQITLGLPSLRVGSVDDDIIANMASIRRPGCTLAPEAGSQRLRDVINKGVTEAELLLHLQKLLEHGWRQVKLYFMIGLPTETDEDLDAIVSLCKAARDAGGPGAPRMQLNVSISPFVPKPFTPFQWEEQISLEEMQRRINYLRGAFRPVKGIKLKWHDPAASHLEGILSRGGRELAPVIESAWRKGAIFCGWAEHFRLQPWLEALDEHGISPSDCVRARRREEKLPWSHLFAGVTEEFLWRERERAYGEKITRDCRFGPCYQCGSCDTSTGKSQLARIGEARHRLVFDQRDQTPHRANLDENGRLILRNTRQERPELDRQLGKKAIQYRVWHVKKDESAWLSHLELQAVLQQVCRRGAIPVSFSQGFHPLPLISFGRALPVGAESEAEWFGIALHRHVAPARLLQMLNGNLPAGLRAMRMDINPNRSWEQAISEVFAIHLPEKNALSASQKFGNFAEMEEFFFTRTTKKGEKTENIRPFLLNWRISVDAQGGTKILFAADWSNGYLSPVMLARAIMDVDAAVPLKITKLSQTFANGRTYTGLEEKD